MTNVGPLSLPATAHILVKRPVETKAALAMMDMNFHHSQIIVF